MTQSCRCHAVSGLIPCATLGSHLASGVAHLYPGSDVVCRDCLKLVMNISSFVQRVNPSGGLPPDPQMDDPNAKHPSGPDSPDPSDHHSGHSSDPDSDQPDGSDGGSIEPQTDADDVPLLQRTYATAKEAGNVARRHDGRFMSLPGLRGQYSCFHDGCTCMRIVRQNKETKHLSIAVKNPCRHGNDPDSPGTWQYLPPKVEADLCTLLRTNNTPVQALARLRKMYRKDPTVRRLKPKWVQNYYNRNITPCTPKLSIEALEEWMRTYTRDPPDTDCPHEDAFILHSERGLGDWLPSSIIHWMGLELPWKQFGS